MALGVDLAAVPWRVDLFADPGGSFKLCYGPAAVCPFEGGEKETLESLK